MQAKQSFKYLIFIILLGCSSLAAAETRAATITGNVYDLSLNLMNDIKITVNSQPEQMYISKNGTYSFDLGLGNYTIDAEQIEN